MEGEVDLAGRSAGRLAELVDAYARRICPAVLAQHDGASVSSPLGVWLLLAVCVSEARGEDRDELERVLGCPAVEASELLRAFISAPPPALKAAIAVWVRAVDATETVAGWVRSLPASIESGYMPTQPEADSWAEQNTDSLIRRFPTSIDARTRIVL